MKDFSELTDSELIDLYKACRSEMGKRQLDRQKREQEIRQTQEREEEQER